MIHVVQSPKFYLFKHFTVKKGEVQRVGQSFVTSYDRGGRRFVTKCDKGRGVGKLLKSRDVIYGQPFVLKTLKIKIDGYYNHKRNFVKC